MTGLQVHQRGTETFGTVSTGVRRFIDALEGNVDRARYVSNVRRYRSRRAEFFEPNLFADPAWDILLELYLANLEQRRISVSSLCAASEVPITTGLRWLAALQAEALTAKRDDPLDGRRVYVSLTPKGFAAMSRFFDIVPPQSNVL